MQLWLLSLKRHGCISRRMGKNKFLMKHLLMFTDFPKSRGKTWQKTIMALIEWIFLLHKKPIVLQNICISKILFSAFELKIIFSSKTNFDLAFFLLLCLNVSPAQLNPWSISEWNMSLFIFSSKPWWDFFSKSCWKIDWFYVRQGWQENRSFLTSN